MRNSILLLLAGISLLIFGGFLAAGENAVLNVIIDVGLDQSAEGLSASEREALEKNTTIDLLNALDPHDLNVTVFATGEASQAYPLYLTKVGSRPNHEMGVAGMSTDEPWVSPGELESRLYKAKRDVESNYICGGKQIKVEGYKPQKGSLNQTVYGVVMGLGIGYLVDDSGNQTGWPIPVGEGLYSLPVSSMDREGTWLVLSDRNAAEAGLEGSEWRDLLAESLNSSMESGTPTVAVFTNYVSGSGEYLDAYRGFVDYAASQNATFVTCKQLVAMSIEALAATEEPAAIETPAEEIPAEETPAAEPVA